MAIEYVVGGEFFTHLRKVGRFDHSAAKFFATQISCVFEYMHASDFIYRDLKPENLLLDHEFNLKIADFGFAGPIEGKNNGYLTSYVGTFQYLAPEQHLNLPYQGRSVDLFAAGTLLFNMVTCKPPFNTATSNDSLYRCIANNRADIFWRTHCKEY